MTMFLFLFFFMYIYLESLIKGKIRIMLFSTKLVIESKIHVIEKLLI